MAEKSLAEIFGANIQRKRKMLGLTQEELSERLGVGQQSLSRMERGAMAPKFERLSEIARVLHCPVSELFVDAAPQSHEYASTIGDILSGLTQAECAAVLRFVADASLLMRSCRDRF